MASWRNFEKEKSVSFSCGGPVFEEHGSIAINEKF